MNLEVALRVRADRTDFRRLCADNDVAAVPALPDLHFALLKDLIQEGEEAYAAMRRSTNGGGENSPLLSGEDDYYEMFFASL